MDLKCPDCGAPLVLRVSHRYTYRSGEARKFYGCSRFPDCQGSHSANPDGSPLGVPADAETKKLRTRGHKAFEVYRNLFALSSARAIDHLSVALAIANRDFHFSLFDADTCRRVIDKVETWINSGAGPDERAFLARIRETPEDDTPRLVYADWLDEHDRPDRAAAIRNHCAGNAINLDSFTFPDDGPWRSFSEIRRRAFGFRQGIGTAGIGMEQGYHLRLRSGFVDGATMPTATWLVLGPLLVRHPLVCLMHAKFTGRQPLRIGQWEHTSWFRAMPPDADGRDQTPAVGSQARLPAELFDRLVDSGVPCHAWASDPYTGRVVTRSYARQALAWQALYKATLLWATDAGKF